MAELALAAKATAERAARKAAEAKVRKYRKRAHAAKTYKIPKPKGTCGRDYKLRQAMRLGAQDGEELTMEEEEDKKRQYLECLVSLTHTSTSISHTSSHAMNPHACSTLGRCSKPCYCRPP